MNKSTMDNIVHSLGAHVKLSGIYLAVELLYYRIGKCLKHNILAVIQAYTLFLNVLKIY